jgi:hypothetical protein
VAEPGDTRLSDFYHVTGWAISLAQADEVIDELRTQVDDLTDENNRLRAWKAEATQVICAWDLAYDLIVPPGFARLGASKQTELVNYVKRSVPLPIADRAYSQEGHRGD